METAPSSARGHENAVNEHFASSPLDAPIRGGPPAAPRGGLVSAGDEARAFWRMRLRVIRTLLRQTFSSARFRLSLILVLSGMLWYGLFRLIKEGFSFLVTTIPQPTYDEIVHALFGTFFAALMLMLVFSASIILYSSLFRSREMTLLLTLPARDERVFLHKFQEAVVFSSWGFLLLGSPMLLAYGIVVAAPWYYYAMLLPYMVAFVYVPVAVGAILCVEVVYRLPRKGLHLAVIAGVVGAGAAAWFAWMLLAGAERDLLDARLVSGDARTVAVHRAEALAELVAEHRPVAGRPL